MKLSLVFELLLIFILLAFAASKSVKKHKNHGKKGIQTRDDGDKIEDNSINKYCKCKENYCNCCRDFKLPVVELNGPGCASLMYLDGDKMSVSLSFGKKVITNRTLSSRKPSPVCMPLPGGVSKFCGRVYNIARAGEEFRACLGLELQSKTTVEAAVRVSCFKFGPRGVTSEPADPLPLVPQEEKDDDDDDDYDDDDDDDEFGLVGDEDDDDDDDDDGPLDAENDVESADYTGFSLLGEDILGDLFGSSGSKKPNKNTIKKKQAPTSTTTTTTTRRPRPTRRPVRRPSTRTTTARPTRTTTLKVRPGTRRPTRRPSRRPTRRPTQTTESVSTSILTSTTTTTTTTTARPVTSSELSTAATLPQSQVMKIENNKVVEASPATVQDPMETILTTTAKSVTGFDDPGLEMSLAHITGQLSVMPVTAMLSNDGQVQQASATTIKEEPSYEKIETITRKVPPTIPFASSEELKEEETVNDDMIQIVQNLDSHSAESVPQTQEVTGDESRGYSYTFDSESGNAYEGLVLPKKNKNNQFSLEDLDVLDLSEIGESLGSELGLFGRNKRQNKDNKKHKLQDEKEENDYDEMMGDVAEGIMMMRKSGKNMKNRRRQNKMMRDWSQQ